MAVVLGIAAVGLGALALTRGADAPAASSTDPAANARTACALLGEVPDSIDLKTQWDEQAARLGSAEMLAQLAAARDPAYAGLADALRRPREVVARTFRADGPEFSASLSTARQACAGR